MKKIVVDSGCDYTERLFSDKDTVVETIPLYLQLEDKQFIDDKNLDIDEYIAEMEKYPKTPKTAAPSPNKYLESFEEGESVFGVTLSSHLSGSYSAAVLAKKLYGEKDGAKFIHIFDSLNASVGEMVIALKIQELIKNGLQDVEIVEKVNSFIEGLHTYFILDRFDNLTKTGRMNPYIAQIASVLNIKPICAADEGKIALADKARGYKRAVDKLLSIIESKEVDFENRILGISHVRCLDKAIQLKEAVMARIKFKDIIIVEASGLCSTYAQRGGVIMSY